MKFDTDIHGSQTMNTDDFGEPSMRLTFVVFSEMCHQLLDGLPCIWYKYVQMGDKLKEKPVQA